MYSSRYLVEHIGLEMLRSTQNPHPANGTTWGDTKQPNHRRTCLALVGIRTDTWNTAWSPTVDTGAADPGSRQDSLLAAEATLLSTQVWKSSSRGYRCLLWRAILQFRRPETMGMQGSETSLYRPITPFGRSLQTSRGIQTCPTTSSKLLPLNLFAPTRMTAKESCWGHLSSS